MEITSPKHRRTLALAVAGAGVLTAWLALEPAGLLVAVTAIGVWRNGQAGLAAIAASGLFWVALLFWQGPVGTHDVIVTAVFLAAAGAILALVQAFRSGSLHDMLDQDSHGLVNDVPGFGWSAYPDGRLRFINPAILEYVGISAAELRKLMETEANPLERWTHPDNRERARLNWERALRTGQPLTDETWNLRHDGVYRLWRDTVVPSRDKSGRIVAWYGHGEDITDQRNAEAALRAREHELRMLVDTVPTMIWLMTPEGLPYYFNKRFVDWAGVDPAEEPLRTTSQFATHVELYHPDDRAAVRTSFHKSFATGEPLQHKARLCRKDGQYRWVDSRFEPLRDENGAIVRWYGVNLDIDEEVRAQESLRLAHERLALALRAASLSELSVSIAHELNQPLQAVVANAGAFQRWLDAEPPNFDHAGRVAQKIIRNADAAAQVINRIRALFAKTAGQPNPVDLNAVITEVCDLLGDKLQSNCVKLDLDLDPGLPATAADQVQMEQVVLNLVRNGIEAMQDVALNRRNLKIVSRRQGGDIVEVEVSDQGRGLKDPERVFEPFYTTKQHGMGMGLAICRSIIESHGGRLWAGNTDAGGASIAFSLPIRAADESQRVLSGVDNGEIPALRPSIVSI